MRDTCCQRLSTLSDTGSPSALSRTSTGLGVWSGLMSSRPDGSMGTCRTRISGAGCQGATRAILWRAWPPPMRGCSLLSASMRRLRLSSRTSFSRPICVPDSPVKPDRVRVTSSTGVLGRSISSLLRTTGDAFSHEPTGCLNLTLFSQDGQPDAAQSRSANPAYRPFMSGRA